MSLTPITVFFFVRNTHDGYISIIPREWWVYFHIFILVFLSRSGTFHWSEHKNAFQSLFLLVAFLRLENAPREIWSPYLPSWSGKSWLLLISLVLPNCYFYVCGPVFFFFFSISPLRVICFEMSFLPFLNL